MIREFFCIILVFISCIIPSQKFHKSVLNFIEDTFVISDSTNDNMSSQAVQVFSDSETLLKVISSTQK